MKLEYNARDKGCKIICAELPDTIIKNMLAFRDYGVAAFIGIIEANLETFCMGRMPDVPLPSSRAPSCSVASTRQSAHDDAKSHALPSGYNFPLNANITPNLKYDSIKSNVFIFTCTKANIQVECRRCGADNAISESTNCKKCANELRYVYIPKYDQNYLGFLGLGGCNYICANAARYQCTCSQCNAGFETPPLGVGDMHLFKCFGCFAEIKIKIESILLIQKKDYNLKIGNELPGKGTCKHYKKSFRWFRFECCNSLYPCDICHNDDNSHRCEEAKRMVCGLCSKEQSIKKDCSCGMSLKKNHTRFWEGGKGNREQATMSKKDSKKYRK